MLIIIVLAAALVSQSATAYARGLGVSAGGKAAGCENGPFIAWLGMALALNGAIMSNAPYALAGGSHYAATKNRMSGVNSYICYYGCGDEDGAMAKLSGVDLAIIDARLIGGPPNTPETGAPYIAELKKAGTIVIVYISVGEEWPGDYNPEKGWYLSDEPNDWNSYTTDPGNPEWQENVLSIAKHLMAQGADGLFLDTIDSAFGEFPGKKKDMARLVKRIRSACPDAILIANRGFDISADIAPVVDGYMFEGFSVEFDNISYRILPQYALGWNDAVAENLIALASEYGFKIIVLDYVEDKNDPIVARIRKRSAAFGFLLYIAPGRLDSIY